MTVFFFAADAAEPEAAANADEAEGEELVSAGDDAAAKDEDELGEPPATGLTSEGAEASFDHFTKGCCSDGFHS